MYACIPHSTITDRSLASLDSIYGRDSVLVCRPVCSLRVHVCRPVRVTLGLRVRPT